MFADATKFRWKTTNVTLETRLSTPGGAADTANKSGGGGILNDRDGGWQTDADRPESRLPMVHTRGGSGLVGFAAELPARFA